MSMYFNTQPSVFQVIKLWCLVHSCFSDQKNRSPTALS